LFVPTALYFSILVVVFIIIEVVLFHDVQLDGIQADDFQLDSALFAVHYLAFVRVGIDMHIGFAFWARSSRHLIYLQNPTLSAQALYVLILMKPANLTAGQNFLQHEILRGASSVTISSEKQNFAHNVERPLVPLGARYS